MKRVLSFLCLAAFLCQTAPIQAAENAADADPIAKEKEITKQRMLQIHDAIQAYRKDHKDLPGYLSDLFPTYLTDTNVLLCPTAVRQNAGLPFPELNDPKLTTHYGYEFSARPIESMFGYSGPMTMAAWKRMQMMVVGGVVPILRCFAYDKVINLSFDGNFYESPIAWEELYQDKIKPDGLQPKTLRLVIMKSFGSGMAGEESAFELLKESATGNDTSVIISPIGLSEKDKKWNQEAAKALMDVAAQARKFLADFPKSTNSSAVAALEQRMLMRAITAGSDEAEQQFQALMSEKFKAPGLSGDERYRIRSMMERASMDKLQNNPQSEQQAALQLSAQKLMKEFPTRSEPYTMVFSATEDMDQAKARTILEEISKSTTAPEEAKQRANALLKRFKNPDY